MKARMLRGWTMIRFFYLLVGVLVIIQSLVDRQWLGLLPGGYFAAMAVFRFGCAAGACSYPAAGEADSEKEDVRFEEIRPR